MAKARQTISVEFVKVRANTMLALGKPHDDIVEMRHGIAVLLESILHESGNYRGFGYLETYEEGVSDESRRHYY